jgi:polysaccharide biosynthesis/export protein
VSGSAGRAGALRPRECVNNATRHPLIVVVHRMPASAYPSASRIGQIGAVLGGTRPAGESEPSNSGPADCPAVQPMTGATRQTTAPVRVRNRSNTMTSQSMKDRIASVLGNLALLALTLSIAACAGGSRYPAAPASAATTDYRYVIGPLDTVNIIVWRNPELSLVVTVRPDGNISVPLVEDLPAVGRTPSALARDIEKALGKYARDPVVTVIVTSFQGASGEQIRIIGEAAKPQTIPYRQNMTLLDVMIQVGGLTDFADGNNAVLVRGKEDGKQYSVRLKDLVKRGDISANVDVRPGDVLIIPQSWF